MLECFQTSLLKRLGYQPCRGKDGTNEIWEHRVPNPQHVADGWELEMHFFPQEPHHLPNQLIKVTWTNVSCVSSSVQVYLMKRCRESVLRFHG